MMRFGLLLTIVVAGLLMPPATLAKDPGPFQIAVFQADVTIPLNHRCMGVLPTKSQQILDPLEAIGFVLIGGEQPIVVCAVDWCEIRNGAYDQWRSALAQAAGTRRECVLVTSLHQHDAPVCDSGAAELLDQVGLTNELYDTSFHAQAVARVAAALRESVQSPVPVTHIGTGQGRVEKVASNRRVVLPDGRVVFWRGSRSATDPVLSSADDGQIDPDVRTLSFWNQDHPVAALSVYATHPMSSYGAGAVSADFVGLARRRMQQQFPEITQIYASGCSGDVTAGKYNDGSPASREQLVQRLYEGMLQAWQNTTKSPLSKISFRSVPLHLDYYAHGDLHPEKLQQTLQDPQQTTEDRILAAMGLSSYARVQRGQPIDFPTVDLGSARLLLFPGESFVGYQLMAQQSCPEEFVVSLGYGECWTGYVPLNESFADGFHDKWLWVPPGSENRVRDALHQLLQP